MSILFFEFIVNRVEKWYNKYKIIKEYIMSSSLITSAFWERYNLLNQSFSEGLDLSRSKLRFDEDT